MIGWIAGKLGLTDTIVAVGLVVSALGAIAASYGFVHHDGVKKGKAHEYERQAAVMRNLNFEIRRQNTSRAAERVAADMAREKAVANALAELPTMPQWTPTTVATVQSCGISTKARTEANRIGQ